ncbi:MAG: cryptochrome/photolyase family protein [Bacteroidota bacterium]
MQIVVVCMSFASIVFPHQLYKKNPALVKNYPVYLVEEWLFFDQYQFHQQKLVLHRASMKAYQNYLEGKGFEVVYIDAADERSDVRKLIDFLSAKHITSVKYCEVTDDWLNKRLELSCKKNNMAQVVEGTPGFLNSMEEVAAFFDKKKTYFQTDFYTWQRKKRNILLEADGKPIGGKWTFDSDNRQRFPKDEKVPVVHYPAENSYVKEARTYVATHWADNYGNACDFKYATTFAEAEAWLDAFLNTRLGKFGNYEDALVSNEGILYHSVLTPVLNIGLLTPNQIITKTLDYAASNEIPMNSLEGFLRQIMGWREFIRIVYEREGSRQRTKNYWGFTRKIPASFWKGETGILPIDTIIRKTLATAYNHHIERLMVLGNFMLLCEFDPNEVYRWFMEMYIDAYDWVMVPNIYGMTQFADGGLMTTKPYISGSNYLKKMGDFKTPPTIKSAAGTLFENEDGRHDWEAVWDGLFWRFMHVHRHFFLQNPRLGMLVKTFDKMSTEKQRQHLETAEKYLDTL